MNRLIETVFNSIQDLIASGIKSLPGLLIALVIFMLTRYGAKFAEEITERVVKKTVRSQSLQLLFSKISYVTAWIVGILMGCVIAFPSLRLGDIIATLGLGSVAVGFAFQDIFKNFLAGIILLIQEPFRINDQIVIDNYEGTVERIDIRTTKIRTYTGECILLPNSTVFTSAIRVRTAFNSRRTDLAVGVDYNTSLPIATNILQQTIESVEGVLESPSPEIDLVSFGESSIDFVVRYWTYPRQQEVRHVQTRAIVAIKKAFDEANINIPYPIRTLYWYDQQLFDEYIYNSKSGKSRSSNSSS